MHAGLRTAVEVSLVLKKADGNPSACSPEVNRLPVALKAVAVAASRLPLSSLRAKEARAESAGVLSVR